MSDHATIVAVATASGRGAIGIVRLSGDEAAAIAGRLCGRLPAARRAGLRSIRDADGNILDDAVVLHFPAPHSFTGEDVVEIHAHGAPVVLEAMVTAALACGARRAEPGEFSRRAFENGRIDLAQAEAIADLVNADSTAAARAARASLSGVFSEQVADIGQRLGALRVQVEAAIDFSDEDLPEAGHETQMAAIDALQEALGGLLADARRGSRLARGAQVVLAGPPNAGKSTLLNRLCGEDLAIVTDIPGTTRDVLQHDLLLEGLPVRLFDTAGLREGTDPVEREGVRRTRQRITEADLVLMLVDDRGPSPGAASEEALAASLPEDIPCLWVHNKCDLSGRAAGRVSDNTLRISARTGAGVAVLLEVLAGRLGAHQATESPFSARQRHVDALVAAEQALRRAREALAGGATLDLIAEELRQVQLQLDVLLGKVDSEALLGQIFSSFCIGK